VLCNPVDEVAEEQEFHTGSLIALLGHSLPALLELLDLWDLQEDFAIGAGFVLEQCPSGLLSTAGLPELGLLTKPNWTARARAADKAKLLRSFPAPLLQPVIVNVASGYWCKRYPITFRISRYSRKGSGGKAEGSKCWVSSALNK